MVVQSQGSQSEGEEQGGKKGGQRHLAVPSPAESHTAWPQETTQGQATFNCCCWEQAGAGRGKEGQIIYLLAPSCLCWAKITPLF